MSLLVVDAGGTRMKMGVVTSGELVRFEMADATSEPVLEVVERAGRELLGDDHRLDAVGLCVPGLVDEDGTLVSLPGKHAGLEGTDLRQTLATMFSTDEVVVVNDAIAYSVGEAMSGAGRGARRSVVVTIGTGVGVGVIESGTPVTTGLFGGGILGGFIPIDQDQGPRDSFGQQGTIEARCAADRLLEYCGGVYPSVPEVYEAHERGDRTALSGVEKYRSFLVRALVALAHAHSPERVILGGGPMRSGNPLTPRIDDLVNERLYGAYRVSVRLAELGDKAALLGLAHLSGRGR